MPMQFFIILSNLITFLKFFLGSGTHPFFLHHFHTLGKFGGFSACSTGIKQVPSVEVIFLGGVYTLPYNVLANLSYKSSTYKNKKITF